MRDQALANPLEEVALSPVRDGGMVLPSAALTGFVPAAGELDLGEGLIRAEVRYGIRIADLGLLVDTGTGAEVIVNPRLASMPNAPTWFLGLMNLRGNLIPVLELMNLLGMDGSRAPEANRSLVLVYGKGDRAIGVRIDALPEAIRQLEAVNHLPPLPERLSRHIGKGYMTG